MGLPAESRETDVALPPGEYMHVQDTSKGIIKTHVGPALVSQTGNDQPVLYNAKHRRFDEADLQVARCACIHAEEDAYVVLHNPAVNSDGAHKYPSEGVNADAVTLRMGETVIIAGPDNFALFPQQRATVIAGHRLCSNQYLLISIVDGQKATDNWKDNVAEVADKAAEVEPKILQTKMFATGELFVVKGVDVKFFMPCTGVAVLSADSKFIRDAMTLERLEFCVLCDENGKKRYERGPAVVFPKPSETFWTDDDGNKKFRAFELTPISGVHIKVIDDYKEKGKTGTSPAVAEVVSHKAGDELFLTGKSTPIYFPQEEHSIVTYGQRDVHYATAVPAGEGRYVLDRLTGEITTEKGYQMLLCDPRSQVVVRRVLADAQCHLWFPGSTAVLAYNRSIQPAAANRGFASEAEIKETTAGSLMSASVDYVEAEGGLRRRSSRRYAAAAPAVADALERKSSYTPPRTVTLDTKMTGAVGIQVWTGYAVMVVSKTGTREAVVGPCNRILDYDEELETLNLSQGTPKNHDQNFMSTVYLRVRNNKVSDCVRVHTSDHVELEIRLSYLVNFGGEPENWFSDENYVKTVCQRCASILKGAIRQIPIQEFYGNSIAIVRDTLLGTPQAVKDSDVSMRPGRHFGDNDMTIEDIDVMATTIVDSSIGRDIDLAQRDALTVALKLQIKQRALAAMQQLEKIEQQEAGAMAATRGHKLNLERLAVADELALTKARLTAEEESEAGRLLVRTACEAVCDLGHEAELARSLADTEQRISVEKTEQAMRLELLDKQTEATIAKLGGATPVLAATVAKIEESRLAGDLVTAAAPGNAIAGMVDQLRGSNGAGPITDSLLDALPEKLRDRMKLALGGVLDAVAGSRVD